MSNIIKFNEETLVAEQGDEIVRECSNLADMTEEMLKDIRKELPSSKTLSMPIAELALLGAGVSSLLPALRGGAPIHWAIINGYEKTGMTIMYMDKKMDSGDIISQRKIDILDTDILDTLYEKMSYFSRR